MNRSKLLTLGLLGVFILSACTPNASAPSPTQTPAPEPAAPAPTAPVSAPSGASEVSEVASAAPEIAEIEEPEIIPTSRGDELHATDPATVNIASGEPQLIEFFAFW